MNDLLWSTGGEHKDFSGFYVRENTLRGFIAQFLPGTSWKNYGEWYIDHIFPLVKFDLIDRNKFVKVCHPTNLQPLWATYN